MSFEPCATPSDGEYLEIPSTEAVFNGLGDGGAKGLWQ